jgi:hypothetical protein
MYLLTLDIRPTAALTFRILPGSILDITTYPFVPPTTLSGFLRRLVMVAAGVDVPGTTVDDAPYYVLPPSLIALGAYPLPGLRGMVHRTHRKGVKNFADTSFTRIRVAGKGHPTFQLHTWEYLIADRLRGYVAAEDAQILEPLRSIRGYGCKLGKEGFAYVEAISELAEMTVLEQNAPPAAVVPIASLIDAAPDCPFDLYTLHAFVWKENEQPPSPDSLESSPVRGYKPFAAAWCPEGRAIPLSYFSTGDLFIPCSLLTILRGEAL